MHKQTHREQYDSEKKMVQKEDIYLFKSPYGSPYVIRLDGYLSLSKSSIVDMIMLLFTVRFKG